MTPSSSKNEPVWQHAWIEDLGDITTARATEAMILIVSHILHRRGFTPFAISLAR